MSLLGPDGKPAPKPEETKTQEEAQTESSQEGVEGRKLTPEEIEKMAESYPNDIVALAPAGIFFVMEKHKETGEFLPPKLIAQNGATGEMTVLMQDASRTPVPDEMGASIEQFIVKQERLRRLMGKG